MEGNGNIIPLIGNSLVWKIGKGSKVKKGMDPWLGFSKSYTLSNPLITALNRHEIFRFIDGTNLEVNTLWNKGLKLTSQQGL